MSSLKTTTAQTLTLVSVFVLHNYVCHFVPIKTLSNSRVNNISLEVKRHGKTVLLHLIPFSFYK